MDQSIRDALDRFGRLLMESRDLAVESWQMQLAGKMKAKSACRIDALTREEREKIQLLLPEIVDTSLHSVLCMLQDADDVKVSVELPDGKIIPDLKEVSDGLPHELYTEDGWISRFSTKPQLPFD